MFEPLGDFMKYTIATLDPPLLDKAVAIAVREYIQPMSGDFPAFHWEPALYMPLAEEAGMRILLDGNLVSVHVWIRPPNSHPHWAAWFKGEKGTMGIQVCRAYLAWKVGKDEVEL